MPDGGLRTRATGHAQQGASSTVARSKPPLPNRWSVGGRRQQFPFARRRRSVPPRFGSQDTVEVMHLKNHGGIAAMRDAARDYNTSSQTSPVDSPQVLTAARVDPTILPTPYPTTPTTSYYSPPTLWPAFRIIVDESAAPGRDLK